MLDRQKIFQALKQKLTKSNHSIATIAQELCDEDVLPFYFQKGADYYYLVYVFFNGSYRVAESITSLHFRDDITIPTLTKDVEDEYLWRVVNYFIGIDKKAQERKQKTVETAASVRSEERPNYETQFTVLKDIRSLLEEILEELKSYRGA